MFRSFPVVPSVQGVSTHEKPAPQSELEVHDDVHTLTLLAPSKQSALVHAEGSSQEIPGPPGASLVLQDAQSQ